jgi:hypothetical protein
MFTLDLYRKVWLACVECRSERDTSRHVVISRPRFWADTRQMSEFMVPRADFVSGGQPPS